MPIDYKLYVKETPSQRVRKWRKISEYKEMLEIPSVRMIHPYVSPVELYKKCSLAITIIGSAGLEAAFYEKPSIVFSDVNYVVLPSVSRIKSFDELSNAIHDSLNKKVVASDLEKYITLVKKNSFPADIFGLRTSQHDHFFYGGYLIDVDITIPKMKGFLEENKSTFEKLADENFEKIAVIRTRQALISLDDRTLADIGYTRQQVLNGDFFNVTDVVNFPAGKLGVEKTTEEKKAA